MLGFFVLEYLAVAVRRGLGTWVAGFRAPIVAALGFQYNNNRFEQLLREISGVWYLLTRKTPGLPVITRDNP